jgi:hypothetical protein
VNLANKTVEMMGDCSAVQLAVKRESYLVDEWVHLTVAMMAD